MRYAQAAGAGLLLACAFPRIGFSGAAWMAPGLLLLLALGTPPRQAFGLGYVAGLAFNLTALHWLLYIPVSFFPSSAGCRSVSMALCIRRCGRGCAARGFRRGSWKALLGKSCLLARTRKNAGRNRAPAGVTIPRNVRVMTPDKREEIRRERFLIVCKSFAVWSL